ncbi:MAG: polymer-forming cytoskeletal protein [Candidatus Berkelbacteria bacterium]|nr:polymer-forming cytoskeletal protein [Candidatus Berkelbacteria bacterium]
MENSVDTIIGVNVTLKGNLYNKGSIQVNGSVEGEVKSDENVIVGESAHIKGPVIAKKIEVSGEIKGMVEAIEKLEINPTGKIIGDLNAKSLIIKEGASFVGKSIMPSKGVDISPTTETETDKPKDEVKAESEKTDTTEEHADKLGFFSKK